MRKDRDTESHVELLRQHLRKSGGRCTPERLAILDIVDSHKGRFTAADVEEALAQEHYHVAAATVYSTLEVLTECGLIYPVARIGAVKAYESATAQRPLNIQLVCQQCGDVKEIANPGLNKLIEAQRFSGFTQRSWQTTVLGLCWRCKRKQGKK